MSLNTGKQSRHSAEGQYEHECAFCGVSFRDNNPSTKHCCFAHKKKANNRTFYRAHRNAMILRVLLKRKTRRRSAGKVDFDKMSNEELIEFVRQNPHAIRVKRR